MRKYDVIIVGAGPAGIFTALEMIKRGSKKNRQRYGRRRGKGKQAAE